MERDLCFGLFRSFISLFYYYLATIVSVFYLQLLNESWYCLPFSVFYYYLTNIVVVLNYLQIVLGEIQ